MTDHRTGALLSGAAAESDLRRRTQVTNISGLLLFAAFGIFGLIQIFVEDNRPAALLGFSCAIVVAVVLMGLKLTGNVQLVRNALLSTMLVLIVVLLSSGGTAGTGIYWTFIFPVTAFFLVGKRRGLFWALSLLAIVCGFWIVANLVGIATYYNHIEIRQTLIVLIAMTVALYAYQNSLERAEEEARVGRRAERHALSRMSEMHVKVDKTKSEFVTLASHQLRTPISAISWVSELLLSGDAGKLNQEQLEHLRQIAQSNQRMAALVDAMLTVSSLDLGNLPINPEKIDLAKLSHQVLKRELAAQPAHKDLRVQESYDSAPKTVSFDPNICKLILKNLISNAIKYTPAGGSIIVTIRPGDDTLEFDGNGAVLVEVTDTGLGIPLKEQPKLFTKMFRADNIKHKDTDGTGLGLYVVKSVAEYVGGRIKFVSVENQGSTFTVVLPLGVMSKKASARVSE